MTELTFIEKKSEEVPKDLSRLLCQSDQGDMYGEPELYCTED